MGKASRKMNKRRQQQAAAASRQAAHQQGVELDTLFEQGEYAEVINTLAEIVKAGQQTPEELYKGAYSYFMLGDYTRAAGLVTAVLDAAPSHVAARILLARICILEDRIDDGLAIFDFIFEHDEAVLTDEQREDAEDILDYYARSEGDRLAKDFPHVAAFLGLEGAAEASPAVVAAPEAPAVQAAPVQPAPVVQAAPAPVAAAAPASAAPAAAEAAEDLSAAESERDGVLANKKLSLHKKVRLLNVFAGAHFAAGEHAAAAVLLSAALDIDAADPETLRNLAVLAKCMGESDKALALGAKLPQTDFLLLDYRRRKED